MASVNSNLGTASLVSTPAGANDVGPFITAPDDQWLRVVLHNVGPTNILLGFAPNAVSGASGISSSGNFTLVAGREIVLVLAPFQKLYGTGVGAGALISFFTSIALPLGSVNPA